MNHIKSFILKIHLVLVSYYVCAVLLNELKSEIPLLLYFTKNDKQFTSITNYYFSYFLLFFYYFPLMNA